MVRIKGPIYLLFKPKVLLTPLGVLRLLLLVRVTQVHMLLLIASLRVMLLTLQTWLLEVILMALLLGWVSTVSPLLAMHLMLLLGLRLSVVILMLLRLLGSLLLVLITHDTVWSNSHVVILVRILTASWTYCRRRCSLCNLWILKPTWDIFAHCSSQVFLTLLVHGTVVLDQWVDGVVLGLVSTVRYRALEWGDLGQFLDDLALEVAFREMTPEIALGLAEIGAELALYHKG